MIAKLLLKLPDHAVSWSKGLTSESWLWRLEISLFHVSQQNGDWTKSPLSHILQTFLCVIRMCRTNLIINDATQISNYIAKIRARLWFCQLQVLFASAGLETMLCCQPSKCWFYFSSLITYPWNGAIHGMCIKGLLWEWAVIHPMCPSHSAAKHKELFTSWA